MFILLFWGKCEFLFVIYSKEIAPQIILYPRQKRESRNLLFLIFIPDKFTVQ